MRFINYFRRHHCHMQGSRAECALARSVRKLIVLYFYDFRRRIVDALNIVSLCTQKIAMTVTRLSICSHWSWPSMSDDPGHWFLSISRPPSQKKSLGTSDYKYFWGAFNSLWHKVWSRGTNFLHRLSKMTQAGTLDADVRTAWYSIWKPLLMQHPWVFLMLYIIWMSYKF